VIPEPTAGAPAPLLSICIATFRRAAFIGETLRAIVAQLRPGVEVVVVDGASPDETPRVVADAAGGRPEVRYHREASNSGVDADYDKAVGYARGAYCWLMTDDDLLAPGAVDRVVAAIADGPDLVVVNAESRTPDLSRVIDERLLAVRTDREYGSADRTAFFLEAASYLTFIGGVVVRRETWLSRQRAPYFGSLFIHVGVIFQDPALRHVRVIAEPLVRVRWGNAMWTSRAFEVWMFRWPAMVWSLPVPDEAKARVCPREPWRNLRMLGLHRAQGSFSLAEFRRSLAGRGGPAFRLLARAVALVPPPVASSVAALWCLAVARGARRELWDLGHGARAPWIARWAARIRLGA
jgi:hypothetical protein